MKIAIIVLACLVAVISAKPDGYTNKYDNIDLDQILKSDRLVLNYFQCLMGEKSCTSDGQALKDILPDALQTGCSRCNDKQKAGAKKILEHIMKNKPDLWTKLTAKYDPNGEYKAKFEEEVKKW